MLIDVSLHYMKLPTIYRFLILLLNSREFWLRICQRGEAKLKGSKILIKPHLAELKWASMGWFQEGEDCSSPVTTNIELISSQSTAPHFHTHHPWLQSISVMKLCREKAILVIFLLLGKPPSTIQHNLTLPPNVTTEKYRARKPEEKEKGSGGVGQEMEERSQITNQ